MKSKILKKIKEKINQWIYQSLDSSPSILSPSKFSVSRKRIKRILSSKLFMAYSLKKTMNFILLPDSFDYMEHISNFPPEKNGFIDDKYGGFTENRMLFILWQISKTASNNEKSWKKNGYVAISGKTFHEKVQNYKAYLDYLINTGVIESDNQYEVGVVSKGYRYTAQYRSSPLKTFVFDISHKLNFNKEVSKYPYLTYWYSQNKLKIDTANASNEAYNKYNAIKDDENLWDINKYGIKKQPYPQYSSTLFQIIRMEQMEYNLKLSPKVHRLYSTLTAIPSKYRKHIRYDNKQLFGFDIKNCQSYICCLILNPEFWSLNSKLQISINSLPQNVIDLFGNNLITMIGERLAKINSPEAFKEYINIVSNGLIYTDMINWAKTEKGKEVTKDSVKEVVFSTIFSPVGSRKTWLSGYYNEKFKKLIELFNIIKKDYSTNSTLIETGDNTDLEEIEIEETQAEKPHARLAILFQSIESEIVLHRICKRIFIEKNKTIPIFTIHDCIVTTKGNEDYLKQVVVEEFTNCIGYPPPLGIENWI